jgi:predicted NBD/HSP70 family sugar kinase
VNSSSLAIGVDVGGSSIKCALIDLNTGAFAGERFSTPTPAQGSTEALLAALATVVSNVPGDHAVGLAFPSVIRDGTVRTAGRVKVEQHLSWDAWADELNLVLKELHALLWPDLIVLCGGITEEPEKFMNKLHCEARLCVGALRAEAGIVGAALATTLVPAKRA